MTPLIAITIEELNITKGGHFASLYKSAYEELMKITMPQPDYEVMVGKSKRHKVDNEPQD